MGKKINTQIRDNYDRYLLLLNELKNSIEEIIILDKFKQNHKKTRIKKTAVVHPNHDENIELIVESDKYNRRDFKFKLRFSKFFDEPFFRFDSSGLAHKNYDPNIELHLQKIDTPHFHKYDSNGRCIAYQTKPLKIVPINEINLNTENSNPTDGVRYE